MNPSPSLNPIDDLNQLLTYPFMVHALEAGTIVAVLSACVGWYVVLRRQAFAAHTLSVMAFPGAAGAALLGLPTGLGYYVACVAAALGMSRARRPAARTYVSETATIGTVQAVGLGLGFLLLSLNHAVLGGPETLLFGTFLGVTGAEVLTLLLLTAAALSLLALIARPLLFATVDPDLAAARGLPVFRLDLAFGLLLAVSVAATTQITGALLVFALLIAPAASAQLITMRPLLGLAIGIAFGEIVVWLGLGIAYFSPGNRVGFYVTTVAFVLYLLVRIGVRARVRS